MHQKNIVLIGMPGSGKSTVGVILAKTLGFDFIDTDILICRETNSTLQDLIDKKGLDEFIEIEGQITKKIDCVRTVIATGGSVVLNSEAMNSLKDLGVVVYLDVPYDELNRRITDRETRGIAIKKDETFKELHKKRKPIYEQYADVTVSVSDRLGSTEAVVAKIIEFVKQSP